MTDFGVEFFVVEKCNKMSGTKFLSLVNNSVLIIVFY